MVTPIPPGAFHASRQKLAAMLDFQEVARNDAQLDDALAQATAINEASRLHRGFFPWYGTIYRDWPGERDSSTYRIWLDGDELISITSITSGGVTLDPSQLVLYPPSGPPYNRIETSYAHSQVFETGDTWQASLAITGLWGYSNSTAPAGTLTANISASDTTIAVSDASRIGVGDVLLIDAEYMVVTNVESATTGQTLQTPLAASAAGTAVVVTDGSVFSAGEIITLDAEQMYVLDVTGNTLIVKRAWNGTVLATHTGSAIYAKRNLTVTRSACVSLEGAYPGSLYPDVDLYPDDGAMMATAHTAGTNILRHLVPQAVQALTLAEAAWIYQGHASAWQTAPGTTNRSTASLAALEVLENLRKSTVRAIGRKMRARAI